MTKQFKKSLRNIGAVFCILLAAILLASVAISLQHQVNSLENKLEDLESRFESEQHMEKLAEVGGSRDLVIAELELEVAPPESIKHYTDDDAVMLAKLLYRECRGVPSRTEQAAVVWTVLNRLTDDEFLDTIAEILKQPSQFAYSANSPVWDDLLELSYDVLERWNDELNGATDVGRVLPQEYEYFYGDGVHNHFYKFNSDGWRVEWDFHWATPYED